MKAIRDGTLLNSQCECPAGVGPHGTCKHIAALALAIMHLHQTGDLSGMNEGCTDRLQTFHKPSLKYTGMYLSNNPLAEHGVHSAQPVMLEPWTVTVH